MKCYFDGSESGEEGAHKWLTLAGYIANDSFWSRFDRQWEEMLKARYPVAPYIHMREILAHEDPFEIVNGWTKQKVNTLMTDALELLHGIGREEYIAVVCSIDLTARDTLISAGATINDPFQICANLCVGHAFHWYSQAHVSSLELAHVFFDQGEKYRPAFRRQWVEQKTHVRHLVKVNPTWDWIVEVEEKDMAVTPALQACDMLAWGTTRALFPKDRPFQSLAAEFWRLVPQRKVVLDEMYLREKHLPEGVQP